MHNPGVIISKAIQRTQYNAGRIMKEAGLSKLPFTTNQIQTWTVLAQDFRTMLLIPLICQDIDKCCHSMIKFLKSRTLGLLQTQRLSEMFSFLNMLLSGTELPSEESWTQWELVTSLPSEMAARLTQITLLPMEWLLHATLARMWRLTLTVISTHALLTTMSS
jgi:hypothetical protein